MKFLHDEVEISFGSCGVGRVVIRGNANSNVKLSNGVGDGDGGA